MELKVCHLLSLSCMLSVTIGFPIVRRMVDMTYTFDETTLHYPTIKKFEVDFIIVNENSTGTDRPWIQKEEYASATHAGTHMDAPRHFSRGGLTVDQLDISRLIAPAAVVDIADRAATDADATVSVDDLVRWENETGHSLDGTIVLMRSGWGQRWGNKTAYYGTKEGEPEATLHSPGFSDEAARWLVDHRNVFGVGVDTLSLDQGSTGKAEAHHFAAHQILLGHGLFGLENVANMEQIPICGAELHVMPMKIGDGSGAPTRVIAIFPEVPIPSVDVST